MRALGAQRDCGGSWEDLVSRASDGSPSVKLFFGFADLLCDSMACAIREAYAATLTVVILVDDDQVAERDD